ncbi:Ubiquinone biosynthesis O-methyltransferase [uncultured archaeon]|nr:Ubiquinone biosynthesis O-methyltransferase [uncultured archaeon]
MKPEQIKKTYNLFAEDYYKTRKEKEGAPDFFNTNLEMPTTLKLLGNVKNKKILDLGCGPGFYLKILANKKARVKGIDISEESVKIARKENPDIEIKIGDVTKKLPYKDSEFDIVLASLILDHIEDWTQVLKKIKRVLKKEGIFVFSTYNPITYKEKKKKWFFKTFREIEGYFDEDWRNEEWEREYGIRKIGKIGHHHKTYGTIVRFLVNSGFELIDYEDSFPTKISKEKYPEYYKRHSNKPNFCTWKVKKK